MAKPTLAQLHAQRARAREQVTIAQRRLAAIARRERAIADKALQHRREQVGKLVEAVGLPMDLDTLRPLLEALTGLLPAHRADGSNGVLHAGLSSTSVPHPEDHDLSGDPLPPDHAGRGALGTEER